MNHDHVSLKQRAVPPAEGAASASETRRCEFVRDDGSRCRGWRVNGERLCAGHLGLGVAANPEAYGAKGNAYSAQIRRDRADVRPRSYRQALQQAWEEHAEEIVARRLDIIRKGSDADALRAIEAMESRIYGKPKETVEQATTPRTVEALTAMTPEERRQLLHQLEADGRMPVLRAVMDD